MKRLLKWLLTPREYYMDLDTILHLEDDYYPHSYTPSKELVRYYLVQI